MTLQLILSVIYQTVRHSWLLAAVAVKYVLLAHIVRLIYSQELEVGKFLEEVRNHSAETVTGIIVIGFLLMAAGLQPSILLRPFSEFIALLYFGYLFWSY